MSEGLKRCSTDGPPLYPPTAATFMQAAGDVTYFFPPRCCKCTEYVHYIWVFVQRWWMLLSATSLDRRGGNTKYYPTHLV